MKFVTQHLNSHHLLHAPHKWFLAFIASPIHALEVHYQRRYHLQFQHARKLFLFDMLLLASIFVIGGAAAFWHWYDPTVQDLVSISITTTTHRDGEENLPSVQSGEHIFFSAIYKNNSQVELVEPTVHLNMPPGLVLFDVHGGVYSTSTRSINLPGIRPRASGQIILEGQFFGEPNKEYPVGVELIYRQNQRTLFEVVNGSFFATLRRSTLTGSIFAPGTIFQNSRWESTLVIKNNHHHDLENIVVPFVSNNIININPGQTSKGKIDQKSWYLPFLKAGESATTSLSIGVNVPRELNNLDVEITPTIIVNGDRFSQEKIRARSVVAHPGIEISGSWQETKISPGETANLIMRLKNTGTIDLSNVAVTIPLPTAIVAKSNVTFSAKNFPALASLPRGATVEIPVAIPIAKYPSGPTDLQLVLSPKISAQVPGINQLFTTDSKINPIAIGTSLRVNAAAHYYSLEGDQIGRGPLPPRVGKETKYWALLQIQNGTSAVSNVTLTAILPAHVVWTGKTSVDMGSQPTYSPASRTITWKINNLSAHETAHVNFELAFTPLPQHQGTTPLLLQNVKITGFDTFVQKDISGLGVNLDSSLPSDPIAREKGVVVQ